jgi:outer membrane protein assembly factor BamB
VGGFLMFLKYGLLLLGVVMLATFGFGCRGSRGAGFIDTVPAEDQRQAPAAQGQLPGEFPFALIPPVDRAVSTTAHFLDGSDFTTPTSGATQVGTAALLTPSTSAPQLAWATYDFVVSTAPQGYVKIELDPGVGGSAYIFVSDWPYIYVPYAPSIPNSCPPNATNPMSTSSTFLLPLDPNVNWKTLLSGEREVQIVVATHINPVQVNRVSLEYCPDVPADTLIAVPQQATAMVGDDVTVVIKSGTTPNPFYNVGLGVVTSNDAVYVGGSRDLGIAPGTDAITPAGVWSGAADGIWGSMGVTSFGPTPQFPAEPIMPVSLGGCGLRWDFTASPTTGNPTTGGGELLTLKFKFATPGVKTFGFGIWEVLTGAPRTFYDNGGVPVDYWLNSDNDGSLAPNSVVVTPRTTDVLTAAPWQTTAAIGEPVTIVVSTTATASPFHTMNAVGVTLDTDATYVPGSFSIGSGYVDTVNPAGNWIGPLAGIWTAVNPTGFFPNPDNFITSTLIGCGRKRLDFNITPLGGVDVPGASGDLFSFKVTYAQAGLRTIGFQHQDERLLLRTYYTDSNGSPDYFWGDINNEGCNRTVQVGGPVVPQTWSSFHGYPGNPTRSTSVVASQLGNPGWSYYPTLPYVTAHWYSAPAIGPDGTIYLGGSPCATGSIFALTDNGTTVATKWCYQLPGHPFNAVHGTPAIGHDGTIYFGSYDKNVYALTDNGTTATVKWTLPTLGPIDSSPAIGPDGTIYIASGLGDGNLYAIEDCDGAPVVKWTYLPTGSAGSGVINSPTVGPDGTILIGALNRLSALNPDGSVKWIYTIPAGAGFVQHSSVATDGKFIVFGTEGGVAPFTGTVFALDYGSGGFKWAYPTTGDVTCSPAIGPAGVVYVGSQNNQFYALQDSGSASPNQLWMLSGYSMGYDCSPAVGGDGTIYVGSFSGQVHALISPFVPKWQKSVSSSVAGICIGPTGTVYAACQQSGEVCAFAP